MALPFVGRGSAIGAGEESAYGTPVAISNWRPLTQISMDRNPNRQVVPDLFASGPNKRRSFDGVEEAGGSFTIQATYENIGIFLKHLLGSVSTTGAGPYTHTHVLAGSLPTGLTLEVLRGNATNSETFEGCKLTRGVFDISQGGIMSLALDVIAETAATRAAAGSPSYGSAEEFIKHHQAGTFDFNSQNYNLVSFQLTVDNKLARLPILGSKLTCEPERSDFIDVVGRATLRYSADTLYTELISDTQGDATLNFAGTGNNDMNFTLQNMLIRRVSEPVQSAGEITQTVEFTCLGDGTDHGLSIVNINDNTTAIAN